MDYMVIKGYIYFFVMAVSTVLLVWYIVHMYSNRERSKHYEGYSNLVLNDTLDDTPFEANNSKKDERCKLNRS
ncbi:MAG: cbb3-type cytochrome c oxidase subunit 3 [Helicobacteraceae bacterium]|jgi:cbb3-type cytochrome c oxidase CcoQ subunit|nr:cbb3-type cytochrome c oxidase subunit 3 [Helicobacteraceae bacterium]